MMLVRLIFLVLATVAFGRQINKGRELLQSKLDVIKEWGKQLLDEKDLAGPTPSFLYPDLLYWKFLPQHFASLVPNGKSVTWSTPCFKQNVGTATYSADKLSINIHIESSRAQSATTCTDAYMSGTTAAVVVKTRIDTDKTNTVTTDYTLTLPADITEAERWDVENKGVRLMRYFVGGAEAFDSLLNTAALFGGELTQHVMPTTSARNIDFLSKYSKIEVQPRDPSLNVVPDESEVKSGDAFYIMRLDGLNPMLAWAMGSTTGHVTKALWIDGQLYVIESTTSSAYWPTDYIQKTPYRTWIQQTVDADMQVIWAPLSEDARSRYNETAAVEFFKANEGYNYGFQGMIWPWLDTANGNFPCLPPDFSTNCLQWELLEFIIAHVDRLIPEVGDLMWNAGFQHRVDPQSQTNPDQVPLLRTSDYYYQAATKLNMSVVELIQVPEQDSWLYVTTRYGEPAVGRAMVCCVLVCSTWKAAGVFGELSDSINCQEQTNWDDYALSIHSETQGYRQIVGSYSLDLPGFRSKDPYAHIGERCSALPPSYEREAGC